MISKGTNLSFSGHDILRTLFMLYLDDCKKMTRTSMKTMILFLLFKKIFRASHKNYDGKSLQ